MARAVRAARGPRGGCEIARERRLVVVSNRLPHVEAPADEQEARVAPVGGLAIALRAPLEKRRALWVGWSGSTSDGQPSNVTNRAEVRGIDLASFDLAPSEVRLFYNGFSNRTLWPLLHSFPDKMAVRHDYYRGYMRTNRRFAEIVMSLLREDDVVWVHDHHLMPLGRELRRLGWTGELAWFLHTPVPPAEVFGLLPWASELLESILEYDLVGVHTRRYARNLFDSLSTEVPGLVIGDTFRYKGRSLTIRVHPIGTDFEGIRRMAEEVDRRSAEQTVGGAPEGHKFVLSVDRLDYTKGIVHRLRIFEYLLDHYPTLRGKVSIIQVSAPSRTRVPEYVDERRQVDQLVGQVNGRFAEANWTPIRYLYRSYPQTELVSFFRRADVCVVTPLRDGMNLVVKEYVAAQEANDPGAVVLSRFCGAADSMKDAILVNPYDIEATAAAIYRALNMSRRERVRRWRSMIADVQTQTAEAWSEAFLGDLDEICESREAERMAAESAPADS